MNKKIISHIFNLIISDDSFHPLALDFKSLDDALGVAAMYKSDDFRKVWWIDEVIVYDDGSTANNRLSTDCLDGYIT